MDRGAVEMMDSSEADIRTASLDCQGLSGLGQLRSRAHAFGSPALRCPFRKKAGASWAIGRETTAACLHVRAPDNRARSAELPGGTARACRAGLPRLSPARGAPDPAPRSGAA